jgi:hypothetical protein
VLLLAACTSHHSAPHAPVKVPDNPGKQPQLKAGLVHEDGRWQLVDVGAVAPRGVVVDLARRRPLAGYPCIRTDVGNWNPLFYSIGALGEGENIFSAEGYCNLDVTCTEPWCHPELVTTRWKAPGGSDPSYWDEPGAGHLPGTLVFTPVETALEATALGLLGYCSEVDCLDRRKFRRALGAGLANAGIDLPALLADYRRLREHPEGIDLQANLGAWSSLLARRSDLAARQFKLTLVSANFLAGHEHRPVGGAFRVRPSPEPVEQEGQVRFRLRTEHFPEGCQVAVEVSFSMSQEVAFTHTDSASGTVETLWVGEGSGTFRLGPGNGWRQERTLDFGPILLREPGQGGVGGHETRKFLIDYRVESVALRCAAS